MNVTVVCNAHDSSFGLLAYTIHIRFGRSPVRGPAILYAYDFFHKAIGTKDDLRAALKGNVEDAVTVYLKANFDL